MLPSGLPEVVADEEDLARFLTQSGHFSVKMAKPAAFLPSPTDRETSVSRHGREPAEILWAIGREAAGNRPLYGAAMLKAGIVRMVQHEVIADEPPPRHAAIRGWPSYDTDPESGKAKQKELALFMASAAGEPFLR